MSNIHNGNLMSEGKASMRRHEDAMVPTILDLKSNNGQYLNNSVISGMLLSLSRKHITVLSGSKFIAIKNSGCK